MNEINRIANKAQPFRNYRGVVTAHCNRANYYDVETVSGLMFKSVFSPWVLAVGDGVTISFNGRAHSYEITNYMPPGTADIRRVSV